MWGGVCFEDTDDSGLMSQASLTGLYNLLITFLDVFGISLAAGTFLGGVFFNLVATCFKDLAEPLALLAADSLVIIRVATRVSAGTTNFDGLVIVLRE